jgi:hypothetical protein
MSDADAYANLRLATQPLVALQKTRVGEELRIAALIRDCGLEDEAAPIIAMRTAVKAMKHDEVRRIASVQRLANETRVGRFIRDTKGLGPRASLLLGILGDPAERPNPAKLIAYLGLDPRDGQRRRRAKGTQCNWNTFARGVSWTVADAIVYCRASPYRDVYDRGREKYAEATHAHECVVCGGKDKPAAQVGSDLRDGHKNQRAYRLVERAVLIDFWRVACEMEPRFGRALELEIVAA